MFRKSRGLKLCLIFGYWWWAKTRSSWANTRAYFPAPSHWSYFWYLIPVEYDHCSYFILHYCVLVEKFKTWNVSPNWTFLTFTATKSQILVRTKYMFLQKLLTAFMLAFHDPNLKFANTGLTHIFVENLNHLRELRVLNLAGNAIKHVCRSSGRSFPYACWHIAQIAWIYATHQCNFAGITNLTIDITACRLVILRASMPSQSWICEGMELNSFLALLTCVIFRGSLFLIIKLDASNMPPRSSS